MSNKNTLLGLVWMMLSVLVSRLGSLLAQIIAGWYLFPEDFGVFATVFSLSAILMSVKNGGFLTYLLHKNEQERNALFKLASLINYGLLAVLVIFAISANTLQTQLLFSLFAFNFILGIYGLKLRLKLSLAQKYKQLSQLEIYGALVQYSTLIGFLLLDFGVYALALPFLMVPVFETVVYFYVSKNISPNITTKTTSPKVKYLPLLADVKWPVFSSLIMGFALQGDYVALSWNTTAYILGVYFFAFQLTAAASAVITSAIRSVIVPSLVPHKNNPSKFWSDYEFYSNILFIVSIVACTLGVILSEYVVQLLWQGKWNVAIPTIQYLLVSLALRFQVPLIYSAFEALGLWKKKTLVVLADASCLFILALGVSLTNNLEIIAASIALYRLLFVVLLVGYLHITKSITIPQKYLQRVIAVSVWMLCQYTVISQSNTILTKHYSDIVSVVMLCSISLLTTCLFCFFIFPKEIKKISSLILFKIKVKTKI